MGSPMSDDFDSKYDYNRFGAKGKRVGQAILDINAGNQAPLTVGDTLEAYAPEFARQMELCVEDRRQADVRQHGCGWENAAEKYLRSFG